MCSAQRQLSAPEFVGTVQMQISKNTLIWRVEEMGNKKKQVIDDYHDDFGQDLYLLFVLSDTTEIQRGCRRILIAVAAAAAFGTV